MSIITVLYLVFQLHLTEISKMDSNWRGKTVSLNCGSMGHFQGVIDSVHLDEQTITLKKAFQNGVPCKMASVTIRADHIQDLNFMEAGSGWLTGTKKHN